MAERIKKEKWVRLWCSGGRGHRREYETYIRTREIDEDTLKEEAEAFNDQHFQSSESISQYGFKVLRKPPPVLWLRRKLTATREVIEGQMAYAAMLERELGMLPTKLDAAVRAEGGE